MATRKCLRCGSPYKAARTTAKYCTASCRSMASQERRGLLPAMKKPPAVVVDVDEPSSGLIESTRAALEQAGRLETVAGQSALRIAQAMTGRETGAGLAALSKALSSVMAEALDGVRSSADHLDELKARREARRAG